MIKNLFVFNSLFCEWEACSTIYKKENKPWPYQMCYSESLFKTRLFAYLFLACLIFVCKLSCILRLSNKIYYESKFDVLDVCVLALFLRFMFQCKNECFKIEFIKVTTYL